MGSSARAAAATKGKSGGVAGTAAALAASAWTTAPIPTALDSLSGAWMLDRARSDPLAAHLAALGLSDTAQTAAAGLDVAVRLRVEGRALLSRQESTFGTLDRRLVLGEPKREGGDDRVLTLTALSGSAAVISTAWSGRGRVIDSRNLADGGMVMHQSLAFTHAATGATTHTHRYWVRGGGSAAAVISAAAVSTAAAAGGGGASVLPPAAAQNWGAGR